VRYPRASRRCQFLTPPAAAPDAAEEEKFEREVAEVKAKALTMERVRLTQSSKRNEPLPPIDSKQAAERFLQREERQLSGARDVPEAPKFWKSKPLRPSALVVTGTEAHFMNPWFLSRFVTVSGQIMDRKRSGLSAKQQRALAREIKKARHLGLLPFIQKYLPAIDMDIPDQVLRNPLAPPAPPMSPGFRRFAGR
jgi:ribosomal protein S18